MNSDTLNVITNELEKIIPRNPSSEFYNFLGIDKTYPEDVLKKGIIDPFWNLMDRGGKRWRVLLGKYLYESIEKKEIGRLLKLFLMVEIIHNASLVIDDIEDDSDLRRGAPCIHKIYGIDLSINFGNFLYFVPNLILNQFNGDLTLKQKTDIRKFIDEEMVSVHLGQNFDIIGHSGFREIANFTYQDYKTICANKTGCMVRLVTKIVGALVSYDEAQVKNLSDFATDIAIAFQIRDDVLNLIGDVGKYGKEIGSDITEGKASLVVIDCLNKANKLDKATFVSILKSHSKKTEDITTAIKIMNKYGSIEYAQKESQKLINSALFSLNLVHKKKSSDLHKLINYLIEREQ